MRQPRRGAQVEPQDERRERHGDDHRHEHRGDAVGQTGHRRLAALRLLHQPHDLHQHRVGPHLLGLHVEGPGLVDGGAHHRIARADLDRHGLAGEHGLVDARVALGHAAVHRHPLARPDQEPIARRYRLERHRLGVAALHAMGHARAQVEQAAHRPRGAGPRLGLEHPAEQDQDDDHGGGVEVDVRGDPGGEEPAGPHRGGERVEVGRERPHADQQVHVGGAPSDPGPGAAHERPTRPPLDRGREQELDQVLGPLVDGGERAHPPQVAQHHHRQRQGGGDDEAPAEPGQLGGALALLGVVGHRTRHRARAVAGGAHRLGQPLGCHRGREPHVRALGRQVDTRLRHPGHGAERPLHRGDARGAVHAGDAQVDGRGTRARPGGGRGRGGRLYLGEREEGHGRVAASGRARPDWMRDRGARLPRPARGPGLGHRGRGRHEWSPPPARA